MTLPTQSATVAAPSQTPPPITPPNGTPPPKKDSLFLKVSAVVQGFFIGTLTYGMLYATRGSFPNCHCKECSDRSAVIFIGMIGVSYAITHYVGSLAGRAFSYFSPKEQ